MFSPYLRFSLLFFSDRSDCFLLVSERFFFAELLSSLKQSTRRSEQALDFWAVLFLGQFFYPSFETAVEIIKGWYINSINGIHAWKKNVSYCFSIMNGTVCEVVLNFFYLWRCEIWRLWFIMKETGLSIHLLHKLWACEITLWKNISWN